MVIYDVCDCLKSVFLNICFALFSMLLLQLK
jgi:hypothetical protein